jgi:hypothetical protein
MDSGGIPKAQLTFPPKEPGYISSKIESEIFGKQLVRDGTVSYTLQEGGYLPDSYLTDEMLKTHMSAVELLAYNSAKRQGLTNILRKLNDKIRQLVIRASKKKKKRTGQENSPTSELAKASATPSEPPSAASQKDSTTNSGSTVVSTGKRAGTRKSASHQHGEGGKEV